MRGGGRAPSEPAGAWPRRRRRRTRRPPRRTRRKTPPSPPFPPLDDGERLDVLVPLHELPDIEVEGLVSLVRSELVGLRPEPDRLRIRRARLFAEAAEHAALEVHVEPVEDLLVLASLVLLVVPVDEDDVDRALDRAERALDAALLVESEHPAEPVARLAGRFRVLDRVGLPEEVPPGHPEADEDVEKEDVVPEAHVRPPPP